MADQIIIELIGDPSGLKPAEDALKSLSKASEENIESFNKANEAALKFAASSATAAKASKDIADSSKEAGKALSSIGEAANKSITAISGLNAIIAAGVVKTVTTEYKDWAKEIDKLKEKNTGLQEELSSNNKIIEAHIRNGKTTSITYTELEEKSKKLQSQIEENTATIVDYNTKLIQSNAANSSAANATVNSDKATSGLIARLKGLVSVQDKTKDSTDESAKKFKLLSISVSEHDKTAVGLLGHTQTLTTAMGEVGEAIARASGDEDAAAEIKKKTASAMQAIAVAQSVVTGATEAATIANIALDVAMSPLIAIAAAVAAGIAVLAAQLYVGYKAGQALLGFVNKFVPVSKMFGDSVAAVTGLIDKWGNALRDIASKYSNGLIDDSKMHKHKEDLEEIVKTSEKQVEVLKDQVDMLEAQGASSAKIREAKRDQLLTDEKMLKAQIELANANNDSAKAQELKNKLHEKTIELIHLEAEAHNAENEAKKKAADDAKAAYEKKLSDAKTLADTRLSITRAGSKAELDARISDLNAAAAIEINTAKGNAEMIKAIRLKRDQDIASAQAQYRARQLEDEKTGIEAELVLAQKGSQQEYDLRMKILAKERELVAADTTLTANQKLKAFNEINQKEDELYQHLQEQSAAAAQQGQDAEAKRLGTHDTTNQALIKSDQGTAGQVEKLDDQTTDHKKKNAEKLKELEKKAASEAIKLGKEVADAIFAAQAEKRKAALDDTINKLEAQKNSELSNSHLTAAQKKTIEEKYRREEAAAKLKAWKADQKAKAEQAIINGLLAFTTSMAQQGYPAGLVTGLLAIAQAGVTVGTILSKAPPKFAKGVISLDGPGTETSDSIAAYLSRGESVITAERTKQYKPVLEQIQAGIYQPLPIPMLSTFPRLHDLSAYTPPSHGEGSGLGIDYDKLGRAVAQALPKSKVQKLSFDRKGFSHYLLSESGQVQSYNNRYKE